MNTFNPNIQETCRKTTDFLAILDTQGDTEKHHLQIGYLGLGYPCIQPDHADYWQNVDLWVLD